MSIVLSAFDYSDRVYSHFRSLYKNISSLNYEIKHNDQDLSHNVITYFDDKKKKILSSKYEIVGIYDNLYKFWYWAWSVPTLNKNEVYTSQNTLKYGLDLDPSNKDLKEELVTSRFKITDKIQLELHLSIACYLSKKVIYKYRQYRDKEDFHNYLDYYIYLFDVEPNIK